MTANSRLDPTATLTATQALAWAAGFAKRAAEAADAFNGVKDEHSRCEELRGYYHDQGTLNALVALALVACAPATGKGQGR